MDVLSYGVLGLGYQTLFVQGRGAGGFPPKTHGPFRFFPPVGVQGRGDTEAVDSIGVYPFLGVCQKRFFRLQ